MNIVSIREKIKEMHGANKEGESSLSKEAMHMFLHAPVFLYQNPQIESLNTSDAHLIETLGLVGEVGVPTKVPYRDFILVYEPVGQKGKITLLFTARKFAERDEEDNGLRSVVATIWGVNVEGEVALFTYNGNKKRGMMARMWNRRGKQVDISERATDDVPIIGTSLMEVVRFFCYELMSGMSAAIRVKPPIPQGKTVEWQLARTHYCVLSKKQAMEVRDKRSSVTDAVLKRSAHWRRAHTRTLRSDKFTHKQGKIIFVREAWVGPEEWIGLDGKIYKVVGGGA